MILHWLRKSQERILAIGWRLVLYESFNQFYDKVLYTAAMFYLGVTRGWLLMSLGSLLSCAYLFWRYDRVGVDWLFAKTVRDYEATGGQTRFEKLMARISRSRNGWLGVLTFVLANINIDPLLVAVHFRQSHFDGISRRDWGVLVASVAIANLWWGARIGILVTFARPAFSILRWIYFHF